jgi:hypothetical protein
MVREILKLDKVAEKNKDVFPLIFGKWSFFRNKKVLDYAKKRLASAVFCTLVGFPPILKNFYLREKFYMENLLFNFYGPSRYEFSHDFLYIHGETSNKESQAQARALLDEWLEAVCSDSELRNLTETFCKERENELWRKMNLYQEEVKQYYSHLDKVHVKIEQKKEEC